MIRVQFKNTGSPRPTRFHVTRFTPYALFVNTLKYFTLRGFLAFSSPYADRIEQTEPEYNVLVVFIVFRGRYCIVFT